MRSPQNIKNQVGLLQEKAGTTSLSAGTASCCFLFAVESSHAGWFDA